MEIDLPPSFDLSEYEKQSFDKRAIQGIHMDRSTLNFFHVLPRIGFANNVSEKRKGLADMGFRMLYGTNRKNIWYKRKINARIVNLPRIHTQMINEAKPVLLDIFMDVTPSDKDWKNMCEVPVKEIEQGKKSHEKTIRRRKSEYQDIVGSFPIFRQKLIKPDGTFEMHPKIPQRKYQSDNDNRLNEFITSYSYPPFGQTNFDVKDYVDFNYLIRLKKFWKSTLLILNEILTKHRLRKEMDWLVYHIINNDVGLHVLFDNLSLESELKWFRTLKDPEFQSIPPPFFDVDPYPFTPLDARNGILEIKKFVQEFEDAEIPPALESYKISQKTMRKRMYELALHAADAYHKSKNYKQYELIMDEIDRNL